MVITAYVFFRKWLQTVMITFTSSSFFQTCDDIISIAKIATCIFMYEGILINFKQPV